MKKFFAGLAIFLLVAVSIPGIVFAQDDSTISTVNDTVSNDDTPTVDKESRDADRRARIDAIKDRITDRLSAAEERRVSGLCKAAQTVVSRLQTNLDKVTDSRRAKYAKVSEKLNNLLDRLQDTSADTSALSAAIVEMESQSAALITAIGSYQATLSDLATMDCVEDPSGFKAVLTEIRALRTALVAQSKTLKKYITEDIRAILNEIKTQIKTTDTTTEEEE